MGDDEFDGIFDNATVEDFMRETSARSEVKMRNEGLEAFNTFVEDQLRAVRTAWIAAETYMQPLAIVANQDKQRIFIPDDDETLGQFVERMHREAKKMKAIWTFIAKRTMVARVADGLDDDDTDVTDSDKWQEILDAGLAQLGVIWYAERREGKTRMHRHGQMVDDNGALDDPIEGAPQQTIPLFAKILGD